MIYYVEWDDACVVEAYTPREFAKDVVPIKRRQVGFFVEENEKELRIAYGTLDNLFKHEEALDFIMVIPKSSITRMECIKEIK